MTKTLIFRVVTPEQKQAIADYLDGKRFMSRYHQITYDVFVDGIKMASATGSDDDAKKEAEHYALMYANEGKVEIRKKVKGRKKREKVTG